MKFTCTKDNILPALSLATMVASKNVTLPILNNVLITADSQKVEIASTNLDIAITSVVRGKVEAPGTFTVPARTIFDFINLLSEEKVDIELVGTELQVSAGKSVTKIKGSPADDFPVIPRSSEGRGFTVGSLELKAALGQVSSAVAKNDIRPELAGIFWSLKEKQLTLAATDSYRLAERSVGLVAPIEQSLSFILPGRTVGHLEHILSLAPEQGGDSGMRFLVTENQLTARFNTAELTSRLVGGNYPDYQQIIPKEFQTTAEFAVADLVRAVKAGGLFTTTGINAVKIEVLPGEGVKISSSSTQTGEYSAEIAAEITGSANTTLLSHRYLLDGLQQLGAERAQLNIVNGDSPCVLAPVGGGGYLYIIMPIRQ